MTNDSCMGLNVTSWQTSLTNGFKNAYKDSFKIVESADSADYVIKILAAKPFLVATAIYDTGAAAACGVKITYKARLIHENKVVKTSSNTVKAKQAAGLVQKNLESALESMYEVITKDFFSNN